MRLEDGSFVFQAFLHASAEYAAKLMRIYTDLRINQLERLKMCQLPARPVKPSGDLSRYGEDCLLAEYPEGRCANWLLHVSDLPRLAEPTAAAKQNMTDLDDDDVPKWISDYMHLPVSYTHLTLPTT